MNIESLIRHLFTGLAAIGTLLLSFSLIAPESVAAIDKAGGELIEPLVIFLSLIGAAIARMLISWLGSFFRRGTGGGNNSPRSGWSAALVGLCAVVGLFGAVLPSCSGEYPVTGTISYRDPNTGAKAGLTFKKCRVISNQ